LSEKLYEIKMSNKQAEFISKVKWVLCLFNKEDNKYNSEIMLFVMQSVEDYILKRKSGEYKKKLLLIV
jgi:hypothetical protein